MLEECSPKGGPEPATERRGSTRLESAAGPSDGPGSGRPAMVGPIFKGPTMPREPSPAARACPAKISFFSERRAAGAARRAPRAAERDRRAEGA